ncbi:MarR family transcriptional regulator [Streptomyces sp. NBS 14/10]|uniref:MarR family winged helix-turn-helix transcriptional regulator n=1 Tax=Streptomyces sp. NBS 14/10 TaxID=1945643 RepID=UPI000B7D7B58
MAGRQRLEDRIIDAMASLLRSSENYLEDLAATFSDGLRRGTIAPLILLHRVGSLRVSELAEALGLDRTTVTRHLDELEPRGLITRRPDERDRRAMMVNLTPAAASHLDAMQARNRQRIRRICAEWTPGEREMFGRACCPGSPAKANRSSAARPTRRDPRQRDRPQAADRSNSPSTTSPRRLSGRHVRDLGSGRPVGRRRPGVRFRSGS